MAPLHACEPAHLAARSADVVARRAAFQAHWARAEELGGKGLAWGDTGGGGGGVTLWTAWKGSALEEALAAAEQLMEALRQYIAELNFAVGVADEPNAPRAHAVLPTSPSLVCLPPP
jgi:hypothetical protein